jgi:hypothetical protein
VLIAGFRGWSALVTGNSSLSARYLLVIGLSAFSSPLLVECCGIPLKPKDGLNGAPSVCC